MSQRTITVYGSGCKKCKTLHETAQSVAANSSESIDVEYITDIVAISMAGIMSTPALAIDGKVVSTGKVLDSAAIEALLA